MSHKPILINDISLIINQKLCFEDFTTQIQPGKHIVIMGNNGSGKSTLLKMIQALIPPSQGSIQASNEIIFGYVPQTITDYSNLSGGQRFNKTLSNALAIDPDVLCLDEPTNHLDANNKHSLTIKLQRYPGTLIIISHDPEILALDFDEIWHIKNGKITIFKGNYSQYLIECEKQQQLIERQREQLHKEKRTLKKQTQAEIKRASKSKKVNQDENDRTLLGAMKESGSRSSGKNLNRLGAAQKEINQKLSSSFVHKKIDPKFSLNTQKLSSGKSIISIVNGDCGYNSPLIQEINLQLQPTERIAIIGDNGAGKSTLIKALLKDPMISIHGQWQFPSSDDIGYIDQHYSTLNNNATVSDSIHEAAPLWTNQEIQKHLNNFLFCKPEQINTKVFNLSGGEKARLSLAYIAAKNPQLLLLDEITNNIDLETRTHLVDVLKQYPGTMIIISHDSKFLQELSISTVYEIKNGTFTLIH